MSSKPKCNHPGCKAYSMKNRDTCYYHSDRVRLNKALDKVDIVLSNDPLSLNKFLAQQIMLCKRGKLDPKVLNSVNNGVNTMLNIQEMVSTEAKIEKLTRIIEQYRAESIEQGQLQDQDALISGDSEYEQ